MPIAAASTPATLDWLTTRGITPIAARVDAAVSYTEVDMRGPVAIVLGSEATGLSGGWDDPRVSPVGIPMLGVGGQPECLGRGGDHALRGRPAAHVNRCPEEAQNPGMDTFDFVIIGAGPAGEAAAFKARERGASGGDRRPRMVRRQLSVHRLSSVQGAALRRREARRQCGPPTRGRRPPTIVTS